MNNTPSLQEGVQRLYQEEGRGRARSNGGHVLATWVTTDRGGGRDGRPHPHKDWLTPASVVPRPVICYSRDTDALVSFSHHL